VIIPNGSRNGTIPSGLPSTHTEAVAFRWAGPTGGQSKELLSHVPPPKRPQVVPVFASNVWTRMWRSNISKSTRNQLMGRQAGARPTRVARQKNRCAGIAGPGGKRVHGSRRSWRVAHFTRASESPRAQTKARSSPSIAAQWPKNRSKSGTPAAHEGPAFFFARALKRLARKDCFFRDRRRRHLAAG